MATLGWREDALHRTEIALIEWLQRVNQRQTGDELLNGEIFYSITEAKVLIEQ